MAKKTKELKAPIGAKKKTTLAKFFRDLHAKPAMMETFTSGAQGRREVLKTSNLTPAHQKLLTTGCVPDIIRSLAGVPPSLNYAEMYVDCIDPVTCGHEPCKAFSKRQRPRTK